jgi:hypothetical protein
LSQFRLARQHPERRAVELPNPETWFFTATRGMSKSSPHASPVSLTES